MNALVRADTPGLTALSVPPLKLKMLTELAVVLICWAMMVPPLRLFVATHVAAEPLPRTIGVLGTFKVPLTTVTVPVEAAAAPSTKLALPVLLKVPPSMLKMPDEPEV